MHTFFIMKIGQIEYRKLSMEYLEEAIKFLKDVFSKDENVCKSVHLAENEAAFEELSEFPLLAAHDGVSIIAVDKDTRKIIAVLFNKLLTKEEPNELPALEYFSKQCKQPQSLAALEFMGKVNNMCNLFDFCHVDHIFETLYLATSNEYRGRGIGYKLLQISINSAKKLAEGVNIKHSLDGSELSVEPKPQLICGIFTALGSQKLATRCGFQIATVINYDDCFYNGQSFTNFIEDGTPSALLEYIKL